MRPGASNISSGCSAEPSARACPPPAQVSGEGQDTVSRPAPKSFMALAPRLGTRSMLARVLRHILQQIVSFHGSMCSQEGLTPGRAGRNNRFRTGSSPFIPWPIRKLKNSRGIFDQSSLDGPELVTQSNQNRPMTCRYAHRRVALLFTAMEGTSAARVINWPQKSNSHAEARVRAASGNGKSQRGTVYASK